jgi:hypothetical protein
MFVRGSIPSGSRQLNTVLTRDPRLYEECIVNGQQKNLDWTTATMSGYPWELWYNGADGGTGVVTQTNTMFGSGYGYNKYYLGTGAYSGDASADSYRYQTQWVALSLADMYLTYAEALVMRTNKDTENARLYAGKYAAALQTVPLLTNATNIDIESEDFYNLFTRLNDNEKQIVQIYLYMLADDAK